LQRNLLNDISKVSGISAIQIRDLEQNLPVLLQQGQKTVLSGFRYVFQLLRSHVNQSSPSFYDSLDEHENHMTNRTFTLIKIVTGGQAGADLGALIAARDLHIPTGGFAPKGWLTENGTQEDLLRSFGLMECEEDGSPPRTRRNVIHSDG